MVQRRGDGVRGGFCFGGGEVGEAGWKGVFGLVGWLVGWFALKLLKSVMERRLLYFWRILLKRGGGLDTSLRNERDE